MPTKRVTFLLVAICLLAAAFLAPQALAAPPSYTLTTEVVGSGSIDPTGGTFKKGTTVTLTATPADENWRFDHWEGDLSGTENPLAFRIRANTHAVAVFVPDEPVTVDRAGLRSSPYGISPFPPPEWWVSSTTDMASRFGDAAPEVVWVVGEVLFPVDCGLSFPNPTPGVEYPNIVFKSEVDENEPHFDAFDQAGVRVWLQVEPGDANVSTLIDLVLQQYGHHPSVIGFGVDVEWYQYKVYQNGKAVEDDEAQAWAEQVRSYDQAYLLFTKHWLIEKMPPTYRTGMVFISDSQGFRSLEAMVSEFKVWGQAFEPAGVGFQYGYARDRKWWRKFSDPPGDLGEAILQAVPNTTDLIWVDFTADEIWPVP